MDAAPLHDTIARAPKGGRAYWLNAADGVRIRIAAWSQGAAGGQKGTVLLLTGRTEYVEKYGPAAAELAARGYAMLAVDWRGQGLADRLLADPAKGHVMRFSDYQLDLAAVIAAAEALELPRPFFLLGHSMGGAIGLRALFNGLDVRAAAFSAPMWGIRMPRQIRPVVAALVRALANGPLGQAYAPSTSSTAYVYNCAFSTNKLTTDASMWAFMLGQLAHDPALSLAGPTVRWLSEALDECANLATLPALNLPCYTALGTRERIIDTAPVHARMAEWRGGHLDLISGAEHEVMMETSVSRTRFYDAATALFDAQLG
ncbi:alpha/beta fold hydrolase [Phaeovulum sp.]|uniref:alpha/beta fold hydrolase n=1 Tax=Phaeovulum sp. TaxID=2934796 RepID=UPI0039E6E248